MKKSLLICVLMVPVVGYNQATYFNNRYDILNHDASVSVATTDSGYLFGGVVDLTNDWRIGLLMIDFVGNVKWQKTYGKSGLQYWAGNVGSLVKTFNNGYALGGGVDYFLGNSDGTLWKFNQQGDSTWMRVYGDSTQYFEAFYQCKQTPDSGFILIGVTNKTDTNGDIWLVKTDKNGNFEWEKTYGGAGVEYGFNIEITPDGGYILGGDINNGNQDTYIIKTDNLGVLQWSKTYGGIYLDCSPYIYQFSDGSYMVTSCEGKYILSGSYTQRIIIVMKLDSAGDTVWKREFGPARYAASSLSIHRLQDGNFVIAGQSNNNKGTPNGNGWPIGFILKVSPQGDSIWYREYEYDTCAKNDDYIRDMKPTSDGGFITAGFFLPNTSFQCNDTGTQDMWVMKLDSCGCLYAGCDSACQGLVGVEEFQISDFRFQIYPNPTDGKFIVEIHNKIVGKTYKITLYDILGREIKRIKTNSNKTYVDISASRNGIYFVQVNDGSGSYYSSRVLKY